MRWMACLAVIVAGLMIAFLSTRPSYGIGEAKPVGIDKRIPWTTSKIVGSPEPPSPYKLERIFPKLSFDEPLEIIAVPGAKKWLVAERKGKIYAFDAAAGSATKELVLDVGRTIYGMALHPKFPQSGELFVTSITEFDKPAGSRVSRFSLLDGNGMRFDPKSEKVVITWPSGGHNGGCIRFGPDGYLYLVTGDGSGIADGLETGQDVSDLLGALLRIDVDHPAEGKGYGIPKDNPFINTPSARPELWAYGLRQLWKFSFDTASGELWGGEVGQDLWDMVLRIEKGGNYGWSITEGSHPFRPERKKGPTPILPPVVSHSHVEFRSITGGYISHGSRLPELAGAYIYGDYDTGRVWMLRHDGKKVTAHQELCDTNLRIVAFGQDATGEVIVLDFMGGIYQLERAPAPSADAPKFPRKLSETGLFTSTRDLTPAPGVLPYSVNSELWSDGAIKERWIALPGTSKIEYETVTYPQPAPGSVPGWRFPHGTVLVKHFAIDTPKGRRRLETRIMVAERVGGSEEVGDQVWGGYTYIWNDAQTDAELADAKGVDRSFTVKTADGEREQRWHFPSRAECSMCHTVTAKYALGVNTAQMNRDHNYSGTIANQLATFEHLGLFDRKLPAPPEQLPRLVDYRDEKASIDDRARAYLHANCSHCHRKWGGGNAEFQLLATLPLKETGTIDVKPAHGNLGLNDPRLLVPGDPARSMIYHRMTMLGLGRMPHIASNVVDENAVKLMRAWITQMK